MKRAARRRNLVVMTIGMVLAILPAAQAATGSGTILLGHPVTQIYGATEVDFKWRSSCNPANVVTQGVDGWVVDMGSETWLRVQTVSSSVGPVSFNIAFYGADCGFRPGPSIFNGGSNVTRNADGAKWAVISVYSGENVTFNWTTCHPDVFPFTYC